MYKRQERCGRFLFKPFGETSSERLVSNGSVSYTHLDVYKRQLWDTQVGRDKIADLADYAASKGVALYLWYTSNGYWNDAPQSPRSIMRVWNESTGRTFETGKILFRL